MPSTWRQDVAQGGGGHVEDSHGTLVEDALAMTSIIFSVLPYFEA
jgi:hypothetical protein